MKPAVTSIRIWHFGQIGCATRESGSFETWSIEVSSIFTITPAEAYLLISRSFCSSSLAKASMRSTLPVGSVYTEPSGGAHFAMTGDEAVTVLLTGFGPTDTVYENPADDPTAKR